MTMFRLTRWQDLSKYKLIVVDDLVPIVRDIADLHIFKLSFHVIKYGVRTFYGRGPRREYGEFELTFDHTQVDLGEPESANQTTMYARIFLGNQVIEVTLAATAYYAFSGYDYNIQDYLYTYFCGLVHGDSKLQHFGEITLPEKLSNYYPGCEYSPYTTTSYHRGCVGTPLTVRRLQGKNTQPLVLRRENLMGGI